MLSIKMLRYPSCPRDAEYDAEWSVIASTNAALANERQGAAFVLEDLGFMIRGSCNSYFSSCEPDIFGRLEKTERRHQDRCLLLGRGLQCRWQSQTPHVRQTSLSKSTPCKELPSCRQRLCLELASQASDLVS